MLGGKWPHRLDDADPPANIGYAVLRGAIATLVDFHDGKDRTDADVVKIDEVYEDAVHWVYSVHGVGELNFDNACWAVGIDPVCLRDKLRELRTRICLKQYIRYQPCAICGGSPCSPVKYRGAIWPLCGRHSHELRRDGMMVFRARYKVLAHEVHRALVRRFNAEFRNRCPDPPGSWTTGTSALSESGPASCRGSGGENSRESGPSAAHGLTRGRSTCLK